MNYYLMNFLLAFVKSLSITQDETLNRLDSIGSGSWGKGARKESTSQIQTIFAAENLVPVGFAEVVENYKNLTGKTA